MAKSVNKNDSELQQAVLRELQWDKRVDETEVGVQVEQGVVTLSGKVTSWAKRAAAEEAAHRVRSVLDVANDLEVKPLGSLEQTDTSIAHAVRAALEWDVFVPDTCIKTTVTNGRVTLEGDVDFWAQKDDAERAVRNLAGVVQVINDIVVKPRLMPSNVRESIEEALDRQAKREARRIQVAVEDGEVTLSGQVHSWAELQAVLGAARGTHGVQAVRNRLRVEE